MKMENKKDTLWIYEIIYVTNLWNPICSELIHRNSYLTQRVWLCGSQQAVGNS